METVIFIKVRWIMNDHPTLCSSRNQDQLGIIKLIFKLNLL